MQDSIIDWRGVAAGLTLSGLLDDSYLALPAQGVPAADPAQAKAAARAAGVARLEQAALRHLLD
jgi:hypothetical protein